MSEHASPTAVTGDPVSLETGLEALQSSPEFRGPVEPLEEHEHEHAHANDHFALIYESQEKQFAAAIPFIRQGLERNERCLYITYENSREEVVEAMRAYDIDVDAVLESGQLSIHDEQETYLRNETFDADETIEFIDAAIEEATEEYEALRMTGEMSSVLEEDPEGEELVKCEAKANYLFDDVDGLALCQYNRNQFPADVIRDVISTHPLLIHNGRVSHNAYYTPPEEFFGPEKIDQEVDRLLGSLRNQTDAKAEIHQRERLIRESYRITADPALDFEEKLHQLLDLACERMNLDAAGLTYLPEWDGKFRTEYAIGYGDDDGVVDASDEMWTDPSEGCYCRQVIIEDDPVGKADVRGTDWEDDEIYQEHGLTSYLGTKVTSGAIPYGTLWVGSTEPRAREFSETERTFLELIGQWVSYEIERRDHREAQRELYEITAAPDSSFEEKLDALFELGCEQFGLDLGGIAKIDPETDLFEVEAVSGDHDHLVPGERYPLSETYCRLVTEDGETAAVTDPIDAGFEGNLCYDRFGVQTYLGTHLEIDGDFDRTFWFLSTEPRETPITDVERTFVDLMGQWVEYELERRQRERELERTKTRFETVFEQSNDAIFLIDPEADDFVDVNPAAAEMTGFTRDELASLCPSDLHPDELEQFRAFLDRILDTGSAWTEDLHCRHKDGRDLPAEVSASPITLDGRDLVLANVRHIEERKKHERYQRELHEIIADPNASFDEKLERLLELGRERFGLENAYFNDVGDETVEVVEAIGPHDMIEAGASTSLDGTYCEKLLASSGLLATPDVAEMGWTDDRAYETYGLDTYLATTVIVGAEVDGLLCFSSETPREKSFTEAERTFLDLMGQCVSYELERDHREAQLEQKNDRLESFASLLAHELRNPVTIGQIYSQQLTGKADPEAVEYVTEAFDRIEDMVDVLLILTRGREAISERTPVDLARVGHKAWDTVDAPDAVLDIELAQSIQADETYIRHLFRNLLENAVEHGGAEVTVTVGELDDGFYVADDGIGIPPEDRDAVFDEGYTTAADNGGTGIGLAFVQKLAEVYEWEYVVTESEGGGARFEFRNVS